VLLYSLGVGERAIRQALTRISIFFLFLSLTVYRRQIISGSAGPIFAIFSLNKSVLGADDRSGPLFSISQGTLPWQPIKDEKFAFFTDQFIFSRCHSETDCNIAIPMSKD